MRLRKVPKRYVARDLNWRPILGVPTGVVDDTMKGQPTKLTADELDGPGFKYVTTLSNAKRIARRANRAEMKRS